LTDSGTGAGTIAIIKALLKAVVERRGLLQVKLRLVLALIGYGVGVAVGAAAGIGVATALVITASAALVITISAVTAATIISSAIGIISGFGLFLFSVLIFLIAGFIVIYVLIGVDINTRDLKAA